MTWTKIKSEKANHKTLRLKLFFKTKIKSEKANLTRVWNFKTAWLEGKIVYNFLYRCLVVFRMPKLKLGTLKIGDGLMTDLPNKYDLPIWLLHSLCLSPIDDCGPLQLNNVNFCEFWNILTL